MVARAVRKSRTVALLEEVRLQNTTIVKTLAEFRDDVDKRFDAIDKRFDQVDQRFIALERRIELLEDASRVHSREIK